MVCRACLKVTSAGDFIDMNKTAMVEMTAGGSYSYMQCFQICTQLADDEAQLPATICAGCAHDLQVAYSFVEIARQADAQLRASINAKATAEAEAAAQEEELEMERLEMLEETDEDEELVEVLVEDDEDDKLEFMEIETMEEELVEECVDEAPLSPQYDAVEEKPHLVYFTQTRLKTEQAELANEQKHSFTIKEEEEQTAATAADATAAVCEHYAEDELDDEYLIEFNAEQLENESATTAPPPPPHGAKWKCIVCKRELRGDVVYEGHMNMHQQLRPYKCAQCPGAFRCRNALERHEKRRHNTAAALSSIEQQHVEEQQQLEKQQQLEEQQRQVEQEEQQIEELSSCNNNNDDPSPERETENSLKETTTTTTTTLWSCGICKRQLRSEAALRAHQKTHLSERLHECSVCAKRFVNAFTLRKHMCNLHSSAGTMEEGAEKDSGSASGGEDAAGAGDTVVQCELCKKQLLRQNFAKHAAMHERKQQQQQQQAAAAAATVDGEEQTKFLCAHCPRECKSRKLLYQHEKIHEGETAGIIYICADCERQYATQHLLEQHRKQAHKKRDNICPICGNAFKLKNQLVNHMKLHLEKNIQCPQCEKRYARQFDLNVHLRTHTGELPFACHMCEKRFAIKVRLTYHLQKHLGVKHCCKECGAEFNSKQKLKAHSFKHSGMPYRCEVCDDHGFANRDVFKRHLMRVHHTTMSDEALVEMFQRNTGKTTRIRPIDEMKHVVVHTYEVSTDTPAEEEEEQEERLINDEDIAMESEVVHT